MSTYLINEKVRFDKLRSYLIELLERLDTSHLLFERWVEAQPGVWPDQNERRLHALHGVRQFIKQILESELSGQCTRCKSSFRLSFADSVSHNHAITMEGKQTELHAAMKCPHCGNEVALVQLKSSTGLERKRKRGPSKYALKPWWSFW